MMMAWQAQQQRHLRFWLPSPSCRCCLLSQEGRREGAVGLSTAAVPAKSD